MVKVLPTVPSSEGCENFPEAVLVIAEIPLVLPSSEGRGKLGTTGTTVWFTVEYYHLAMGNHRQRRSLAWKWGRNGDSTGVRDRW